MLMPWYLSSIMCMCAVGIPKSVDLVVIGPWGRFTVDIMTRRGSRLGMWRWRLRRFDRREGYQAVFYSGDLWFDAEIYIVMLFFRDSDLL